MTIANAINRTLYVTGAKVLGGISGWMARSARREIDDIQFYDEDVFSYRAEARVQRLKFNEDLAIADSRWNSELRAKLHDYDSSNDVGGYILKYLVSKNDISRLTELSRIYEDWKNWESGRSLWNGDGPTNKVEREQARILKSLVKAEQQFVQLEALLRESHPEIFAEIKREDGGEDEGSVQSSKSVPLVGGREEGAEDR